MQVYIDKTEAYYRKHGGKTVVLARFIPIVRTFAPFVAGVGNMAYRAFALYNVVGAAVWTLSFTLAGYFFGALSMAHPFACTCTSCDLLGVRRSQHLPFASACSAWPLNLRSCCAHVQETFPL